MAKSSGAQDFSKRAMNAVVCVIAITRRAAGDHFRIRTSRDGARATSAPRTAGFQISAVQGAARPRDRMLSASADFAYCPAHRSGGW